MLKKAQKNGRTARERAEREKYCRRLVTLQQSSGLSMSAFAKRHDMAPATFAYWQRKVARGSTAARRPKTTKPQFLQVSLAEASPAADAVASSSAVYEIVLGGGRVLRLPVDFDEVRVVTLLRALASC